MEDLRREKDEKERELEDENNRLRGNIAKMRAELDAISKELRDLEDTKLSLELEIAAYRKLLEGEENRSVYYTCDNFKHICDLLSREVPVMWLNGACFIYGRPFVWKEH